MVIRMDQRMDDHLDIHVVIKKLTRTEMRVYADGYLERITVDTHILIHLDTLVIHTGYSYASGYLVWISKISEFGEHIRGSFSSR
jgi:hypothetical protein